MAIWMGITAPGGLPLQREDRPMARAESRLPCAACAVAFQTSTQELQSNRSLSFLLVDSLDWPPALEAADVLPAVYPGAAGDIRRYPSPTRQFLLLLMHTEHHWWFHSPEHLRPGPLRLAFVLSEQSGHKLIGQDVTAPNDDMLDLCPFPQPSGTKRRHNN
jgi:hypothetical protein